MAEGWELVANILTVVLPTIIGAITSKYIINNWQEKKAEFEYEKSQYKLRKDILDNFEKSFVSEEIEDYNFVMGLCNKYIDEYTLTSEKDKIVEWSPIEKMDESQQPRKVYFEEFKEYNKKFNELRLKRETFLNTIKVYYDRKTIQEMITEESEESTFSSNMVETIYYSKNMEDFMVNYEIWLKSHSRLQTMHGTIAEYLSMNHLKVLKNKKKSRWQINKFKKNNN